MDNVGSIVEYALFGLIVPLVFSVAFVVFIWGSLQYFIAGGHDEEAREKGKSLMFYAFLVLLVLFAVWGLLKIIANLIP